jgi:hypothetical protein
MVKPSMMVVAHESQTQEAEAEESPFLDQCGLQNNSLSQKQTPKERS